MFGPVWATWFGPDRGEQAADEDQEEDAEGEEGELVATQAPPRDRPGAAVWRPSPPVRLRRLGHQSGVKPGDGSEAAAPPGDHRLVVPEFSESGDTKRNQETSPTYSLNSRLVSSVSKVGFQIAVSRLMFSRDEQGEGAGPVRGPGRFFHERFVQFGVFLFLLGAELFGGQLIDLFVQFRHVGLPEVLVVGRLDVFPVEQEQEIVRVRIVLEPVGEPGVQIRGRRVADNREVVVGVEDFEFRFEADFVRGRPRSRCRRRCSGSPSRSRR